MDNQLKCKRCRKPIEPVGIGAYYGCCGRCFSYLHDLDDETSQHLPLQLLEIHQEIFPEKHGLDKIEKKVIEKKSEIKTNVLAGKIGKTYGDQNQLNLFQVVEQKSK